MKKLLFILLLPVHYCQAQLPRYFVYLVKGEAMISKQGTKPVVVQQNALVYKDNLITLKKNAEVTLADNEGRFLVLHSAGSYITTDIEKRNPFKKPDPVTIKYLKLLWNELLNPEVDYVKFKQNNIAGVYGGVERGVTGSECQNLIFPVNGVKMADESVHFKWHQTSSTHTYNFIIYDNERKEVVNLPVKDTQVNLSIAHSLSSIPAKYYWLVKGEKPGCEDEVPLMFEIITRQDIDKIASSFKPLQAKDISNQLRAINTMEKNSLILTAIESYSQTVEANASNLTLFKSYELFLLKYGLEDEAKKLWERHLLK